MITPLIILLFSHLCTDFFLQNDWLVKKKKNYHDPKQRHLALLGHSLIFLIPALPLSWLLVNEFSRFYAIGLVIITITHYCIDLLKTNLEKRITSKTWAYYFFMLDQILHILIILSFLAVFYTQGLGKFPLILADLFNKKGIDSYFSPLQKSGIILCALILLTSFTNIFIRIALGSIKPLRQTIESSNIKVGRYIGGIERILTVLAVIAGEYQALVALYGAKAAMRFGAAQSNEQFAEYFILGTSASALIAIVVGLSLRSVLGLHM